MGVSFCRGLRYSKSDLRYVKNLGWNMLTMRGIIIRNLARDRSFERRAEAMSRVLWPWPESRLAALVFVLAILDFSSTFALLALSGRDDVFESGIMAYWVLTRGGFSLLLLVDLAAVSVLVIIAMILRLSQARCGFGGYGRAGFVFLLAPYVVWTTGAVFNNIILNFI